MSYFSIVSRFIKHNIRLRFSVFCFLLISLGCQTSGVNDANNLKATEGYSKEQTDKLFVVDCLLPGQIRKLGSQMTYLTSRRPIKTTAGDCEIRGGEYVAFDRANYASSLKVWLPQAKKGNADAQVMVGEIYEKGLSGLGDPALAAKWYRKAADQGDSRGQINLGHLYEKGLGVEQSLPEALNWYRKASGLGDTDLEFAAVTEAAVSADYEKKLQAAQKKSKKYQQLAGSLQQQLNLSRQNLQTQQKKTDSFKQQLDQSRERLNQELNKKDGDQTLIKQLKNDLQNNQTHFDNQQLKLVEMERDLVSKKQSSLSTYQSQLESQQQRLKLKESAYHDAFIRIKSEMKLIKEKSKVAKTTQDKLAVERLHNKLNAQKADLLDMGKQIKQLKMSVADNKKIVENLDNKINPNMSLAHLGIELIDPPMVLTRGVPSYRLRSIAKHKKIIGKVADLNNFQSLTVNGLATAVDGSGVFSSMIDIQAESNAVEIIAKYKNADSKLLKFNLFSKDSTLNIVNPLPANLVRSKSYPSINFGRFYALIIGNQSYTQLPSLKTSINDAKEVDRVLRSQYGYKTTLLINASRHQVMTALNKLRKQLSENDNLLIYYAGHGEIDSKDQSAYWLPTDAEPDNTANWLSSHNLTQYLNIIAAKHILVVADSCYSGAMTQRSIARLPEKMAEEKRKKWLNFMVKRKARTVMTSGGKEPVLDSGGGQHSVFAKAFLNVLKQNKGLMEDYELFRAVASNVKKSASLIGFQQVPQYSAMIHTGHQGSPFFFVANNP